MRRITRTGVLAVVVAVASAAAVVALPAQAADGPVPSGYRVVARESPEPGIDHLTLRQDQPAETVHVARLAPGVAARLRPVLSSDVLTGPASGPETTSSMCARVQCVLAVNGDFMGAGGALVGAMVSRGELVTTPGIAHTQLSFDASGAGSVGEGIDWRGQVATPDGSTLGLQAVNRPLAGDGVTLYSRRWGPSTLTDAGAVEAVVQLASTQVLPSGTTAIRAVTLRTGGDAPIGPGQVVLAAHGAGAQALSAFAQRASRTGGSLTVQTAALQSTGASPQLLNHGQIGFPSGNQDSFTQSRFPRTLAGVTAGGETLLVTVDGRQAGSAGVTLLEAAKLMAGLGAVDAVNLDGGGSTTFVTRGTVRNQPSDGSERRVVSALALVPAGQAAAPPAAAGAPDAPRAAPTDPASLLPDLLNAVLQPILNLLGGLQPPQ
jgi:hypothetical protein